jgi:tetratricopeptide (TPR) repeat protein
MLTERIEQAQILEQKGDIVGALELWRAIYTEDNACEDAILGIAQAALLLDESDLAFEFFVKLLILNHDNPWGYLGRANIMFRYNQPDRALSDLARVLELDTPASEIRIDCAALLNENGYSSLAIAALKPIRAAFYEDTDFKSEWLFAHLAANRLEHPDIPKILEFFKMHAADDPFYDLCLYAHAYKHGDPQAPARLRTLITEFPDLEARIEQLGIAI